MIANAKHQPALNGLRSTLPNSKTIAPEVYTSFTYFPGSGSDAGGDDKGSSSSDNPKSTETKSFGKTLASFLWRQGNKGEPDQPSGCKSTREEVSDDFAWILAESHKLDLSCSVGEKVENRIKNRYANIIPYNSTRVRLGHSNDGANDYVNASHVKINNVHGDPCHYIACQGPLHSTLHDFWRMIWEQECYIVIMLANVSEGGRPKCACYWPTAVDETSTYGDFSVALLSETVKERVVVRCMALRPKNHGASRIVTQFHYVDWPDFGVPSTAEDLIALIHDVRSCQQHRGTGPVVVHCSAGVGRTGTYCAVDLALGQSEPGTKTILRDLVLELRTQRPHMVQSIEQYMFCHQAVTLSATPGYSEAKQTNWWPRLRMPTAMASYTGPYLWPRKNKGNWLQRKGRLSVVDYNSKTTLSPNAMCSQDREQCNEYVTNRWTLGPSALQSPRQSGSWKNLWAYVAPVSSKREQIRERKLDCSEDILGTSPMSFCKSTRDGDMPDSSSAEAGQAKKKSPETNSSIK